MKKKTFIVQLLDSKKPSRTSFTQVEDALFYSNDTDAHLIFFPHEQEGFEFDEATVALYNTNDESLVERPAVIETFEGRKSVVLKMTEDILAHWGRWQAQVVFKQGDKINTSVVVQFDTMRYMLDQRPPTLRDVIKVDELYSQLVTVMDEIAGKDVISAPEIILARGGENTLGERLDKEQIEVTAQLAQKVGNGKKAEFEDLSATVLSAIEGGEDTSFDLLSIPQDKSVTVGKTDFINESVNKLNLHDKDFIEGKYFTGGGALTEHNRYFTSGFIPVKNGDVVRYTYDPEMGSNNMLHLYGIDKQRIGATPKTEYTHEYDFREETIDLEGVQYFRLSYRDGMKASGMVTINTPYPDTFVPYSNQLNESFVFNETQKDQVLDLLEVTNIENPLARKIAVFDGDSIAHGGSASDGLSGWAGRIGKRNDMTWENSAIGGGTITAETYKSDDTPRHWVSRNVENLRSDADYIILEGGVNDADVLGIEGLGELSNSYVGTLDDTTFTGALESTFKKAILRFPSKKIGFIIPHKMGSYGSSVANNRRAFFDRAIEVCEKWGIPYIDLWKTVYFTPDISEVRNLYYSDTQHLSTLGYDTITPRIESWMKTL